MADEQDALFSIDGHSVSLADIAGVPTDDIAEFRGFTFPSCLVALEVKSAGFDTIGQGDNQKLCIKGEFEVLEFDGEIEARDKEGKVIDPSNLVGGKYTENFIVTRQEDLGAVKALVGDTGAQNSGLAYADMLSNWVGTRFWAKIKHRADKNDKDTVYANIARGKVQPIGASVTEPGATATPQATAQEANQVAAGSGGASGSPFGNR